MTPQLSFACLILVWGLVVLSRSVWALLDWLLSACGLRYRVASLLGLLCSFPLLAFGSSCLRDPSSLRNSMTLPQVLQTVFWPYFFGLFGVLAF